MQLLSQRTQCYLITLNAHQTTTAPGQVQTRERGNRSPTWLSCLLDPLHQPLSLCLPLSPTHTLCLSHCLTSPVFQSPPLSISLNDFLSHSFVTSCLVESSSRFFATFQNTHLETFACILSELLSEQQHIFSLRTLCYHCS